MFDDRAHPKYDTQLRIPVMLPCMNRNLLCEVWDENVGFDELVATFMVPFPQKDEDRVKSDPKWANLYGPLPKTSGDKARYMAQNPDSGKY